MALRLQDQDSGEGWGIFWSHNVDKIYYTTNWSMNSV